MSSISDASGPAETQRNRRVPATLVAIVLTVAGVLALLCLKLTLPIGSMYWDLVVYFDGSHRLLSGQVPSIDFFAPVGALVYALFAAGRTLFPDAQPLLLAQWMLLVVTLPPLVPVIAGIEQRSRGLAFALLVPFLVFQLLPMNLEQSSSFPSVDGYGLYNRQVSEVLYVLTTALVFERRQRVVAFAIAWCVTALFFLKITGFLSAGLLCAFAFATGRVALRSALFAVSAFLLVLAGLETAFGLIAAYIEDIVLLFTLNEGVLTSRFLQAASIHFGIFGSGLCLLAATTYVGWRSAAADAAFFLKRPRMSALATLLDRDMGWLAVGLLTGLAFETQNTGGQAFIFLWPILLRIAISATVLDRRRAVLVLTLVAATAVPPIVNVLHRSARALIGQIQYIEVPQTHLRALGAVTQRPEFVERAQAMKEIYASHPETFAAIAEKGILPGFLLYTDLDYQVEWLLATDEAVSAILAYEAANGVRFETILSLNFVNPFPYLLDRQAPRHVSIGADPTRAVRRPDAQTFAEIRRTDLFLYPTCPITSANIELREIYRPALEGRREVRLSPCWIGYPRDPRN